MDERSGDRRAFGDLVERHQAMARRVARGVVAIEDVARELANEAMLQAYLSLDRLRDAGRFQSWLYGIVLNVCRRFLRDRKTDFFSLESMMGGLRFEALPFAGLDPDPQEVAEAQELHEVVLRSVNELSPKNRATTLLFYYEQLSLREIAATLGVSVAAVKGRLHKSRGRLRELLVPALGDTGYDAPDTERSKQMVKVTIADIKKSKHTDEETGESSDQCVVILLDRDGNRVLPIWIGPFEADSIAIGLKELPVPRPLTHAFMASLLEASVAELEEVRIAEIKEDTFFAVAKLRSGDAVREVDARPSDAMALAVLTGSPIYVADEVIEKAGWELPGDAGDKEAVGKGVDSLLKDLEERWSKWKPKTEEEREEFKAQMGKMRQKVYADMFGIEN